MNAATATHEARIAELQGRLAEARFAGALLGDPDSIYYLSGYWGYATLQSAGRPSFLWVPASDAPEIITPAMEREMCERLGAVGRISEWTDGIDEEWRSPLRKILGRRATERVAIEEERIPGLVLRFLEREWPGLAFGDVTPLLAAMRMVKSAEEIAVMRQAGEVAVAMVAAAERTIGLGVPEYEVSLAAMAAGTRRAAALLERHAPASLFSPMIHNLQILQSGHDTAMVHRRPTIRRLAAGDPIYLCFCGITVYQGYWLGFDREFFCGSVSDEQAELYELAIRAQGTALEAIRPGAVAEDVHRAADAVYREAGFPPTYRTGRGTGTSILEGPELKAGDKTVLEAGMTFAVDGGVTVPGRFGARVGDSVAVTDTGFEYLTPYPKALKVL